LSKGKQTDEEVKGLTPLQQPRRFLGAKTHNGYERVGGIEAQEFMVSPGRHEAWSSIHDEDQALQALLTHTTEYVRTRMLSVVRCRRQWWNDTMEDFGVSHLTHEMSTDGRTVSVKTKELKPVPTKQKLSSDEPKAD
jgi:hypothetical protein